MFRSILSALTIFALIGVPPLMAQGRGGRGGGAGGQGGGGMGSGQQTVNQTRQKTTSRAQQRQRIHATDQQQAQLRDCTGAAERIRTQARDMSKNKGAGFNAETARQQRDQLREQIRTMDQEHQRLMDGLSADQKTALQSRIQDMDQIRDRVRSHVEQMDGQLAEDEPNGKVVASHARQIEKNMKEWRSQYRKMSSQMGAPE